MNVSSILHVFQMKKNVTLAKQLEKYSDLNNFLNCLF